MVMSDVRSWSTHENLGRSPPDGQFTAFNSLQLGCNEHPSHWPHWRFNPLNPPGLIWINLDTFSEGMGNERARPL